MLAYENLNKFDGTKSPHYDPAKKATLKETLSDLVGWMGTKPTPASGGGAATAAGGGAVVFEGDLRFD